MRERRRDYELMFIISPLHASEEEINTTITRIHQSIVAAGGEMTDTDHTPPWGRRKFAYPIREYAEGEASRRAFNEGYYVLCHFSLPASRVPDVERTLKLSDTIIRYLLTLVETRGHAVPAAVAVGARAPADVDAGEEEDVDTDEELEDMEDVEEDGEDDEA